MQDEDDDVTSFTDVSMIAQHCTGLLELRMSGQYKITNDAFIEIARHCAKLQKLYIRSSSIIDVGLTEIARQCPDLTSLDIKNCSQVTGHGRDEVRRLLPNIRIS